jgi:hypothetical protein
VKKVLNILGTVAVLAAILAVAYLKWWSVLGKSKQGGECSSRAGCASYYCLAHERVDGQERPSSGYCTDSCGTDGDCVDDLRCVVPSAAALDDLPALGRPKKLCERSR